MKTFCYAQPINMPAKILIINSSSDKNCLLIKAFKELKQGGYSFNLWSSPSLFMNQFKQQLGPAKKIFLGPVLNSKLKVLIFFGELPFLGFKALLSLTFLKIKGQADKLICLSLKEKIIYTLPARLLGLKVIWFEAPDLDYGKFNKFIFWLYRINYKLARLIAFNSYIKAQLKIRGLDTDKINLIYPGAPSNNLEEDIYYKIASAKQADFHKKYFTLGVVTELIQKQKIEAIFQAVKTCLAIIPNIQLIIIGGGEERKSLIWLAKKMGIEDLVWLVGEQEQLKKWLDSFDIFLVASDPLKLDGYGNILEAMASGLPVIGPRNSGLEDIVEENKTGSLVEADNNEMLARQIIKLHKDKKLRLHLGHNGLERVRGLFTLKQMVDKIERILAI